jgi:hypothetical protein
MMPSGRIWRRKTKRVLHVHLEEAGEGLKVRLFISPSLLRALAYQWPIGSDGQQQVLGLQPERHNLALTVGDRRVPSVWIMPAVEGMEEERI